MTPPEFAADLVLTAKADGLLDGATVLDLGSGTGSLAIAAALAGAARVTGVEIEDGLADIARAAAGDLPVEIRVGEVGDWRDPADLVIMNPPFGAQRRHADRPFWHAAFRLARRGICAFSLRSSRGFVDALARSNGARARRVVALEWPLAATLAHHRRRSVSLEVDRWDLALGSEPDESAGARRP